MMIREEIKKIIRKSVSGVFEIKVEKPEREEFGDYSTNIALQLKKPATKIVKSLKSDLFEEVKVVEPGFINFFISKEYLQKQIKEILDQEDKFGSLKIGKNKKVNIEFCSANPTGPLHLGHGRGAFWGDTLSNVFEKAGYKVTREYFINDYGRQKVMLGRSIDLRYREKLGEKVDFEEGLYKAADITSTATVIAETEGDKYLKIPEKKRVDIFTEKGLKERLSAIKKLLERINVKYDVWFSEKDLYKEGLVKKAVELLKKKGFTYEKEGALWFSSTKLGDDKDRVLIKSDGESTYFASDVAYHINKISLFRSK